MNKHFLALCLVAITFAAPVYAQTLYVKDVLYITLRSGPGSQYNPVKTVKSGTAMTQLEVSEDERYIKVSTEDGQVGWIPSQYVVDRPIAALRLEAAETRNETLKQQNAKLSQELKATQQELRSFKSDVKTLETQKTKLEKENERIKDVSAQPLATAEENEALRSQNVSMEKELIRLKQEVQVLEDRSDREWFMIGAGVLGLGVLLGLLIPMFGRRKKRSGWGSI
ncbi:MAG: TIGR04211 family SH3 domain-containing protein [Gammaproteobacteria bacterium]|nr:TIGR04211 family SH3 domain-containing protein [Gammaproteobacteria bacterium]